jgi:hypothetical protein
MATIRTFAEVEQALSLAYLTIDPDTLGVAKFDSSMVFGRIPLPTDRSFSVFVFQYFPESLSDSQDANYQSIDVPGGSHPIVQWINNGPRTITFQTKFVQERINPNVTTNLADKHNVAINGAVAALRYLMYPHYNKRASLLTLPPPRLFLNIQGTNLRGTSRGTSAGLPVVLMGVSVNYTSWHANGTPRVADVDLSFQEIIQSPRTGVRFVDRDEFSVVAATYKRGLKNSSRSVAGTH